MGFLKLGYLVFAPLFAALIIFMPFFPNHEVKIRRFAKWFAGLHFIYSLFFLANFNLAPGWAYQQEIKVFSHSLIEPLGIGIKFGTDSIALIMIVLTTFLTFMALIASKSNIKTKHKLYYPLVLILETAVLGVFCAKDMFLFFLFWELELIPMYLLISLWGSKNSSKSALKFLLYTFLGSLFMLFAIALLMIFAYKFMGVVSADMEIYIKNIQAFPILVQILAFFGFFIAFAVKLPIIPFHSWLPDAHTDAATPISMLLAGILLKMGAYGLARFNFETFSDIFSAFAPFLILLGAINIVYASFCAIAQKDLKRLVAYSSIAHMGLVLVGFGAMNAVGFCGGYFQMFSHGILSAGLFMTVGTIYLRTKTRNIELLGGLGGMMKKSMYISLILCLGALGLPLLIGFAPEALSLFGAFLTPLDASLEIRILTVIAATGIIFSSIYMLKMFHKTYFSAPVREFKNIKDLTPHELTVLLSICAAVVIFGLYPMGILNYIKPFALAIFKFT